MNSGVSIQPINQGEVSHPQSAQIRAAQLITERNGDLPIWIRAPTRGREFYSGCSRPKLYDWASKGYIRSISIREPGRLKGVRLFRLQSILQFIERCERAAQNPQRSLGSEDRQCICTPPRSAEQFR
jgi:hypothetical protein